MRGQTIAKTLANGYAGSYARQPDMIVDTHPAGGTARIAFGAALVYGSGGVVEAFGASGTAMDFLGVAVREVKAATDYLNQNVGSYGPGEAVPVMKRGCVNVICQDGTPSAGGTVYVRTVANDAKPNAAVGGFEAAADTGKNVALTNVKWKSAADQNGVAELCILTRNNA